jgi:hypothetical protein
MRRVNWYSNSISREKEMKESKQIEKEMVEVEEIKGTGGEISKRSTKCWT